MVSAKRCENAMRAVDTNLLVRLLVRDDAKQVAAAEAFVAKGAWVSHLVLAETMWVLDAVFGLDSKQIAMAIDMLLRHANLTIQDSEVVAAALSHYRSHPKVGFSDCLILEVAKKAGHIPVGTFDREMAKLEGALRV
jgi:predicted nucleic-acid-binding protein